MGYGLAIKAARKQAGLTQAQLAKKCGMAAVTIQQYERDVREPRKKQLETIASALGVSVDVLYGLNPLPTKKSPSEVGEGRAIDIDKLDQMEPHNVKSHTAEKYPDLDMYWDIIEKLHNAQSESEKSAIYESISADKVDLFAHYTSIVEAFMQLTKENQQAAIAFINFLREKKNTRPTIPDPPNDEGEKQ
jgi:transcriptional regulator with XRE-family HTH domain